MNMSELVDWLNEMTDYYNRGEAKVSDVEWDTKYFELEALEQRTGKRLPNSPTQRIRSEEINKKSNETIEVAHKFPMLSLAKTRTMDKVLNIVGNNDSITMLKLDGISCRLIYKNGLLCDAVSRGDGEVGKSIIENVKHIKNIPKRIENKDILYIDGEIVCKQYDFKKLNEEFTALKNSKKPYKTNRNVSTIVVTNKSVTNRKYISAYLNFVAWDMKVEFIGKSQSISKANLALLSKKLSFLHTLGFEVVPYKVNYLEENGEEFVNEEKNLDYPIDGLVYKINNVNIYDNRGATEHHPLGGIAYKFKNSIFPTKLLDIVYSVKNDGVIVPTAIYDTITIEGSDCSKAGLTNTLNMKKVLGEKPYVGEIVYVKKANQIVPYIEKADYEPNENSKFIEIPTHCPKCGAPLDVESNRFVCNNKQCGGKSIIALKRFAGNKGLDIKGCGNKMISFLFEYEFIRTIKDYFALASQEKEIKDAYFDVYGKSGDNAIEKVLNSIKSIKNVGLEQFINAICIQGVGPAAARKISDYYKSWEAFRCFNYEELKDKIGLRENIIKSIFDYDFSDADEIVKNYITVDEIEPIIDGTLDGLTFTLTGRFPVAKKIIEDEIRANGGIVSAGASVTADKTDYLIYDSKNKRTTKVSQAEKYDVPIISYEEYKTLVKGEKIKR